MTQQQRITIEHIEAQHEAQRWAADQAAREVAQLDELSVIIAVEVKMNEGRIEEACALWRAYRASQRS
jgi:hypothetical protein